MSPGEEARAAQCRPPDQNSQEDKSGVPVKGLGMEKQMEKEQDDQWSLPPLPPADMLPPLTMGEFPSLTELQPEWLTWEDEPIDVADFYRAYDLPQVVKVDGGNYGNFGVGTHVHVQRPFLLYTSKRCSKVLAANIYWDDSKQQYVEMGPRVVIPVNYPGWFHFLQDSGKVGRTLKSVSEVAVARPRAFIVRSKIPCFRRPTDGNTSQDRAYMREELPEGELLNFDCLYTEPVEQTRPTCCLYWLVGKRTETYVKEMHYLRCTDLDGREVLLELDTEGLFSPVGEIGTPTSVDGVHQLGDVVRATDLPTHMKLCWGQPPSSPCSFTGLLRLEDVYFEETVIACTLEKERYMMVEFPTDSDINFIIATDAYRYFDHPVIQDAMSHCNENIDVYATSIKVVQSFYPDHIRLQDHTKSTESQAAARSLPPLPAAPQIPGAEGSTIGSLVTTDDFTDDSEFSDYTVDDDDEDGTPVDEQQEQQPTMKVNNVGGTQNAEHWHTDPVEGDPNYEVIPGDMPQGLPQHPGHSQSETYHNEQEDAGVDLQQKEVAGASEQYHMRAVQMRQPPSNRLRANRTLSHTGATQVGRRQETYPPPPKRWSDIPPELDIPQLPSSSSVSETQSMLTSRQDSTWSNNQGVSGVDHQQQAYATMSHLLGQQLKERLDAFLSDSLQELNRLKNGRQTGRSETPASCSSADTGVRPRSQVSKPPPPPKRSTSGQPSLQSKDDVNAFLESIFDPDLMTNDDPVGNGARGGTLPPMRRLRPASVDATYRVEDAYGAPQAPTRKYWCQGDATLRRHNRAGLASLVRPTPTGRVAAAGVDNDRFDTSGPSHFRPSHLPVEVCYRGGVSQANTFIPIRGSDSSQQSPRACGETPSTSGSSADYPREHTSSSPDTELHERVAARADSGIFVSPRLSDFHLELESPYRAPSEDPSWTPPADLAPLSVTEVAHCLRYIGMKDRAVFHFVEEQIDGQMLLELDKTLLTEGFPELNALERKKVLDFIGGWRPKKL